LRFVYDKNALQKCELMEYCPVDKSLGLRLGAQPATERSMRKFAFPILAIGMAVSSCLLVLMPQYARAVCALGTCIDGRPSGDNSASRSDAWEGAGLGDFPLLQPFKKLYRALTPDQVPKPLQDEKSSLRRDPRAEQFSSKVAAAQAAHRAGNVTQAMSLTREALAIREDSNLRRWLLEAEAATRADDLLVRGDAALRNNDWESAAALYRDASTYPAADTPELRRLLAELEAQIKRDKETVSQKRDRERREQANRPAAQRLNDEALELLRIGRLEEANQKLTAALKLLPLDERISANWWVVQASLALSNGDLHRAIENLETAQRLDPDNKETLLALEKARTRRDELTAQLQTAYSDIRQRIASAESSAVVDARVVQFGAGLIQIGEIAASPAADRARKGLQAAANQDWPVALAWWREALQRDPGNAALKRSVELAEWTIAFRQQRGMRASTPFDPAYDAWLRGERLQAIEMLRNEAAQRPDTAGPADELASKLSRFSRVSANPAQAPVGEGKTDPRRAGSPTNATADLTAAALQNLSENMMQSALNRAFDELYANRPLSETTRAQMAAAEQLQRDAQAIRNSGSMPKGSTSDAHPGRPATRPDELQFISK